MSCNQDRRALVFNREWKTSSTSIILNPLQITLLFGGGILAAVFIARGISAAAQNTKESCVESPHYIRPRKLDYLFYYKYLYSLRDKGISITNKGVSVKTSKRFDREHYVDATQRLA